MPAVVQENVETAIGFLRALSPLDGFFPAGYRGLQYIFRGMESSQYRLVPAAFRDGAVLRTGHDSVKVPLRSLKEQIRAEVRTLVEFFQSADRLGLRLPEDCQSLRETLREWDSASDEFLAGIESGRLAWPPNELLSLMALAQHHKVPTRLLDWTLDPYIAAYFAAKAAATRVQGRGASDDRLCVWAFNLVHDEVASILSKQADRRSLSLVTAPASDNANLRAQRWVGLVYRHRSVSMSHPLEKRSYDELIDSSFGLAPILWQVTLPVSEAGELLRLLATMNVDGATVFPGFDGVARHIEEMGLWPPQSVWTNSQSRRETSERSEALWSKHKDEIERAE